MKSITIKHHHIMICAINYPNIKKQYETEKENILNKSKVAKKEKEDYMRHLEKEDK